MSSQEDVYTALKYRVVVDANGTRCCYNHRGDLHREDGPAIVWCNNTHEWYYKGVRYEKSDYDSIIAGIA